MTPEALHFADDGRIPNSPLPALLYRAAVAGQSADAIEHLLAGHGWTGAWHNGIYPYHHFHSTAHEVLAVARGTARVLLGGEAGRTVDLHAGDVLVLPAGTGHKNEGASPDLLVVGAYDRGRAWDTRRGDPAEYAEVRKNIAAVPMPERDPVTGQVYPSLHKG